MSDSLVRALKSDITRAIEESNASGLVIDVSGIDILDSYISRSIHDVGNIAQLMGVRTVMCGMAPMIALTLTEMGMELEGIETALNLESALESLALPRDERDGFGGPAWGDRM